VQYTQKLQSKSRESCWVGGEEPGGLQVATRLIQYLYKRQMGRTDTNCAVVLSRGLHATDKQIIVATRHISSSGRSRLVETFFGKVYRAQLS
jgi:hypothetical protein